MLRQWIVTAYSGLLDEIKKAADAHIVGPLIAGPVTVEDASSELAIVEAATAALTIDCTDPIEDIMIDEGPQFDEIFYAFCSSSYY